jgi:hypothetical protein
MVKKFFERTVLAHIAFIGIGYAILRLVPFFVNGTLGQAPPPPLVLLITLTAAIYYSHCLKKYRPVPQNPIQQFRMNLIVATYAIVVALSLAIPFAATPEGETTITIWPLPAAIYIFFAWRHVYSVDPPVFLDPHGRPVSEWDLAILEAKRQHIRLKRNA